MKPEHRQFAEHWVKSQNATASWLKVMGAKRSRKTAAIQGVRWLKRADVQEYIQQLRGQAVLLLQGAAEGEPGFSRIGRKAAADLAEILAILTAQARGEAATEFEKTRVTVGEVVGNPFNTLPIPPLIGEILKLVPAEHRDKAQAIARDVTLESRTMTFQPMKAAGMLLDHFDKRDGGPERDPQKSQWLKLMGKDPKLARILSIRFLEMERVG